MNRRDFIKLSALAAGSVLLPDYAGQAGAKEVTATKNPLSDLSVKAMDLNIRYVTEIISPPKHGKKVEAWIPLPQSDHEQEITSLSVQSPVAFDINEEPHYRNKMIHIGPANLRAGDKITVTYQIRRKTASTLEDKDEDIKKHLVLTRREKWNEDIMKFVDNVVGEEKKPLEIGRKIYHALMDFLTYDREIPGCGEGISIWTFEHRRGRCDDFHALFRTMMIYKGVPVRWEQGISLSYPSVISRSGEFEGDCTGAHCWVRFYTGDGKWVPVDISEADKRKDLIDFFFGNLSPNRFKVSTGRDIVLKPQQGGEPLNSFPYAYAEAEGLPLIYGHNYRNVIKYRVTRIET